MKPSNVVTSSKAAEQHAAAIRAQAGAATRQVKLGAKVVHAYASTFLRTLLAK